MKIIINYIYLSCEIGLNIISFTFTLCGDCKTYRIEFAISSACRGSIFFVFLIKDSNELSVIVLVNSMATTPGSIHVTRMFDLWLNFCLKPSLNAVIACLVAQ